jgi:hypothetical protein
VSAPKTSIDSASIDRLVQQFAYMLKAYHEECEKNPLSREAEFWRGNITGLRYTIGAILGQGVRSEFLHRLRQVTGLGIPHAGQMDAQGRPMGWDSDADF